MKKYFIIRILVVFLYIAVLWYGLTARTNTGYAVIIIGMLAGLGINYWNYRVNLKGTLENPPVGEKSKKTH
ncbi:hypothetical protein ACA30_19670 [Virgibacillus soli]|uniref:Uncharacterized protein n=1 Tax=Lederbergia galactosidilytica TaxID=217031 RepID=A0A0Q9Y3V5_9BACI|nr:hypothetical protein ACA29_13370 [Lederbergia galactosidilytica]KRG12300.1 hypothetical protein ACA30_19670 [Virgibacillus soli]